MLDEATWRTGNRRHFAVVEALYEQVGRPLRTEGWDPSDDAEYAAGLVHQVGVELLGLSINAGVSKDGKSSSHRAGKAWKSVSSDSGVRASLFLTLAVAAILSPELEGEKLDQDALDDVRGLVTQVFTVSDADIENIERVKASIIETLNDDITKEAAARGGLADSMTIQAGQTALSYYGMKLAGVDVDQLPAFQPVEGLPRERWNEVFSLDWFLTSSVQFAHRWKVAKQSYVDMAYSRPTTANIVAYRLITAALEQTSVPTWEWTEAASIADVIIKTVSKLSHFREEEELVHDAIALGYWLRRAELESGAETKTFDPDYVVQLQEKLAETDEPDQIITIAMNEVRENMPKPFAQGPEVWSEVVDLALRALEERGHRLLVEASEFDDEVDISREQREFAFGLGYGLAVTVDALDIEGTQPRQE